MYVVHVFGDGVFCGFILVKYNGNVNKISFIVDYFICFHPVLNC